MRAIRSEATSACQVASTLSIVTFKKVAIPGWELRHKRHAIEILTITDRSGLECFIRCIERVIEAMYERPQSESQYMPFMGAKEALYRTNLNIPNADVSRCVRLRSKQPVGSYVNPFGVVSIQVYIHQTIHLPVMQSLRFDNRRLWDKNTESGQDFSMAMSIGSTFKDISVQKYIREKRHQLYCFIPIA